MTDYPYSITKHPGEAGTFYNPVAEAFDPVMVTHQGSYYLIGTSKDNHLRIQKSATIAGLGSAPAKIVYSGKGVELGCSTLWSPSLQFLRGKWYIYFSTTNAERTQWADYVLEGQSDDPLGPYSLKNVLSTGETGHGIIGPSAFEAPDGALYFTTTTFGFYIQPMLNPWTLTGSRVTIDDGSPTYDWEGGTSEVSRVIVHRDGERTVFIAPYSSENYVTRRCDGGPGWSWSVGMLVNRSGDLLNPIAWVKAKEPVFTGGPEVGLFSVLAVNTFKSPDGCEDWMVYNALDVLDDWFGDRDTFVQRFTWNADGTPNFGRPVALGQAIQAPSGEPASPAAVPPGAILLQTGAVPGEAWSRRQGRWERWATNSPSSTEASTIEEIELLTAGETVWADYSVEAQLHRTGSGAGQRLVLLARLQADGCAYGLELATLPGSTWRWRICKVEADRQRTLRQGDFASQGSQDLTLRFILNNERLTAVVSGDGETYQILGEARDGAFACGPIGLVDEGLSGINLTRLCVVKELPTWGLYTGPGWPGIRINAGTLPPDQAREDWVSAVIADETSPGEKLADEAYTYDCFFIGGDVTETTAPLNSQYSAAPYPAHVLRTRRESPKRFCYVIPSLKAETQYHLRLVFAKSMDEAPGKRLFRVTINEKLALDDFDPNVETGSADGVLLKEYTLRPSPTGHILVEFTGKNPMVNAIEIFPD